MLGVSPSLALESRPCKDHIVGIRDSEKGPWLEVTEGQESFETVDSRTSTKYWNHVGQTGKVLDKRRPAML